MPDTRLGDDSYYYNGRTMIKDKKNGDEETRITRMTE
jgi:hypothetical protein